MLACLPLALATRSRSWQKKNAGGILLKLTRRQARIFLRFSAAFHQPYALWISSVCSGVIRWLPIISSQSLRAMKSEKCYATGWNPSPGDKSVARFRGYRKYSTKTCLRLQSTNQLCSILLSVVIKNLQCFHIIIDSITKPKSIVKCLLGFYFFYILLH